MKVLIAGASGLVGSKLSDFLNQSGYEISHLSRKKNSSNYKTYFWNPSQNKIDLDAIENADVIINLSGAGIADKRWTNKRKQEIIDSRINSTLLISNAIKKSNKKTKLFISASGVGFYGMVTSDKIFTEEDKPYNDFLGNTCVKWENAAKEIEKQNIRTIIFRISTVLSDKGGALTKLSVPFKFGLGAALGNGKQFMPWIHIDDLCEIFKMAIENEKMKSIYNATAPESVSNYEFSKQLAKTLKKPFWLPNVPSFILKIFLGEMSDMILEGSKVSSAKIISEGFSFKFANLNDALENLINE